MKIDYKGDLDKLFFTSDTHFFHENIIRLCGRPFVDLKQMDEILIKRWNDVVPEDADVFHMGDLCWTGNIESIIRLVEKLNGRIHLVYGNHILQNVE